MSTTTRDQSVIQSELDTYAQVAQAFAADASNAIKIDALAQICADSIRSGGKILAVGNGGSCADAVHFCEELTGRYRDDRNPIPAIACSDAGHITCVGNDYGFEHIFSRWVDGLGRPGDVLIALSTSGNSANIINAVGVAKGKGIHVATLLGKTGGKLVAIGDTEWIVPGETSDRIQELHMLTLHALVGAIERALGEA
jgi:D-sedoheptulose 7-phosphate isomerase